MGDVLRATFESFIQLRPSADEKFSVILTLGFCLVCFNFYRGFDAHLINEIRGFQNGLCDFILTSAILTWSRENFEGSIFFSLVFGVIDPLFKYGMFTMNTFNSNKNKTFAVILYLSSEQSLPCS